jgi:hypothetical protein
MLSYFSKYDSNDQSSKINNASKELPLVVAAGTNIQISIMLRRNGKYDSNDQSSKINNASKELPLVVAPGTNIQMIKNVSKELPLVVAPRTNIQMINNALLFHQILFKRSVIKDQ